MIHTIYFNRRCSFTNQHGVEFFNVTTGQHPISFSTDAIVPSDRIIFQVEWKVSPQKGDRIKWLYDGSGTYCDSDKVRMLPQDLNMINCADHADDNDETPSAPVAA